MLSLALVCGTQRLAETKPTGVGGKKKSPRDFFFLFLFPPLLNAFRERKLPLGRRGRGREKKAFS